MALADELGYHMSVITLEEVVKFCDPRLTLSFGASSRDMLMAARRHCIDMLRPLPLPVPLLNYKTNRRGTNRGDPAFSL